MALLASDAPRSEHDPDLEAAAAIAMHPVTGAFADPTHESAFAAQFFRLAFPAHAFLIPLNLTVFTWAALVTQPEMSIFWSIIDVIIFAVAVLVLGRVLVHCIDDSLRGQRVGSQNWTALMVVAWIGGVSMYVADPAAACATVQLNYLGPLIALVTALVNGSHGMGFAHKGGLIGLLLVLDLVMATACFEIAPAQALCDVGAHMVGFVVAHMVEMHLRQTYAEKVQDQLHLTEERRRLEERNEQLRAEKERLMYDVQRRGRPLDDGDDRSAIRRGLQAGPSQPHQPADKTDSSGTGAPASSDSPPASLPPGPPSSSSGESSQVSRTSAAVTPAAQLLPRPASRHFEVDGLLDRRCAEMAAASTTEQAGASWARGTKRQAAAGEVAEFKAGAGKASAAKASAGRARAEQGLEQLLGWQVSSDPIYVNARARLAAAQVQTCNAGPSTPPPTSTELDAQHYARLAATSAAERGLVPTGGPSSTAGRSTVPPPSLAELAYRRHYKELALAESAMEQGVPPSTARPPPLTWRELHASAANQATEDELAAAQALSNMSQKHTS